jgi:hypothetical protein
MKITDGPNHKNRLRWRFFLDGDNHSNVTVFAEATILGRNYGSIKSPKITVFETMLTAEWLTTMSDDEPFTNGILELTRKGENEWHMVQRFAKGQGEETLPLGFEIVTNKVTILKGGKLEMKYLSSEDTSNHYRYSGIALCTTGYAVGLPFWRPNSRPSA